MGWAFSFLPPLAYSGRGTSADSGRPPKKLRPPPRRSLPTFFFSRFLSFSFLVSPKHAFLLGCEYNTQVCGRILGWGLFVCLGLSGITLKLRG